MATSYEQEKAALQAAIAAIDAEQVRREASESVWQSFEDLG